MASYVKGAIDILRQRAIENRLSEALATVCCIHQCGAELGGILELVNLAHQIWKVGDKEFAASEVIEIYRVPYPDVRPYVICLR